MSEFGQPPWDVNGFIDPTPPKQRHPSSFVTTPPLRSVLNPAHVPVLSTPLAEHSELIQSGEKHEATEGSCPTQAEANKRGTPNSNEKTPLGQTQHQGRSESREASPPCLTASRNRALLSSARRPPPAGSSLRLSVTEALTGPSPTEFHAQPQFESPPKPSLHPASHSQPLLHSEFHAQPQFESPPQPGPRIGRALDIGSPPRDAGAAVGPRPPCACGAGRPRYRNASGYVCSYCTHTVCARCFERDLGPVAGLTEDGAKGTPGHGAALAGGGPGQARGGSALWAAVDAALASPGRPALDSASASAALDTTTREARCPLCQEGTMRYEEVLLHEWVCEGGVLEERARRGGRKAAYHTSNIQRYYFIKDQHQKRALSTEPLQATFHGMEEGSDNGEDSGKELRSPTRYAQISPSRLDAHNASAILAQVTDVSTCDPSILASVRSITVEPVESDENSGLGVTLADVEVHKDGQPRFPEPHRAPCCVEGSSFIFSVQNPRLEQRLVWCAVDRIPRQTHPVFVGDFSAAPLLVWRCPPSLPRLAPRQYRVRVPYGAYGFGRIHALSLYLMSDIFRKASRQVTTAPSLEHSLAAAKVIPVQGLPPLLTVDILHCMASNPRLCIAQLGRFRVHKCQCSPQDTMRHPVRRRETSLDLLTPLPANTPEQVPKENLVRCCPRSSSQDGNPAVESCKSVTLSWPGGLATRELALTLDYLLHGRSVAIFGVASKYPFLQHVAQSAELLPGFIIRQIDASRGSASFQPYYGTAAVVHQLREVRDVLRDVFPPAPAKGSSPSLSGGWSPGTDHSHAINVDDEANSSRGGECAGRGPTAWWESEAEAEGPDAGDNAVVPFFVPLHGPGVDADRQPIFPGSKRVNTSLAADIVEILEEESLTQRLPPPPHHLSGGCVGVDHTNSSHPIEQQGGLETSLRMGEPAGGQFPYTLCIPPISFASEAMRRTWFKQCRGHARRCVRWNVRPSIMAWRSTPCPPQVRARSGVVPRAFGEGEVGEWIRTAAAGGPHRVLLVLHNVDLLSPASEAELVELCREFAYPRMRLVLLLSFDNPEWPLSARAAAFGQLQLALVQLRGPLLPRVHEMRFLDSLSVLTQLEATTAGRGGGGSSFAKGRNQAPLRDTIRRILLSLPVGFAELLRVLIETQAKHGETAFIPIFTIEQEFEAHGIMVSHGRMKAVQRELTSNRLAVYNSAEHALQILQYRRLQAVLEEVNALRNGGVEQRGFAETV